LRREAGDAAGRAEQRVLVGVCVGVLVGLGAVWASDLGQTVEEVCDDRCYRLVCRSNGGKFNTGP
jgi:hypothetical protein